MRKFACIHGHFYQPPRESPWTGLIERQASAGEDHDWNARIARECYGPNGQARIADAENKTLQVVNNYSSISFNFGATLLTWLEREQPEVYRKILQADYESAARLGGHGNAIAQTYHHVIMPLANARDKKTQILWGLADFQHRFGRKAEALWLPETACDCATLRALIDAGLRYLILAPQQAGRTRPMGAADWSKAALDVRRPYLWRDRVGGSQRSIALFFYDGPLSQAVSFEKLMSSSPEAARQIAARFDNALDEDQLVCLCSDGEVYGHHHPFAEMGLAHLLNFELPADNTTIANFGFYLDGHPPAWEVELAEGPQGLGTSWSCAHGVARWKEDCGCGAREGYGQKWRGPLREALDWLRGQVDAACQTQGTPIFHDFWQAREAYIAVMLDDNTKQDFFARHLRKPNNVADGARAVRLMEIQRLGLVIFTSCGWFFHEISGLEPVQNLRYAARLMELSRAEFGVDWEPEFLERLKAAPSNEAEYGDGAGVYEKLVRPVILSGGRGASPP